MIFTPEEENKLEYTVLHNDFKDLVDRLLTDFLADLVSYWRIDSSAAGNLEEVSML